MMNERKRWLDDPRNVDKIFYWLCGACALAFMADFLFEKHGYFSWEHWTGFHGVYGFISCVGLVLAAKQMRRLVKRSEDYYDR